MNNKLNSSNAGQSMGILALVFGIMALIIVVIPCFTGFISVIFGVCALIFGAIGFFQAKKNGSSAQMAKAGFALGIVAVIINIIWVTSIFSILKFADSQQEELDNRNLIEAHATEKDTIDTEAVSDSIIVK